MDEIGFPWDRVTAAKKYLFALKPWWYRFGSKMKVVPISVPAPPDEQYGALTSTDRDLNLYIDTHYAAHVPVEELAGAIERELQYQVRDAWNRMRWLDEDEYRRYFNVCMDLEVNSTINRESARMQETYSFRISRSELFSNSEMARWMISGPPNIMHKSWLPEIFDMPDGLSAEQYYRLFKSGDPSGSDPGEGDDGEESTEDKSEDSSNEQSKDGSDDTSEDSEEAGGDAGQKGSGEADQEDDQQDSDPDPGQDQGEGGDQNNSEGDSSTDGEQVGDEQSDVSDPESEGDEASKQDESAEGDSDGDPTESEEDGDGDSESESEESEGEGGDSGDSPGDGDGPGESESSQDSSESSESSESSDKTPDQRLDELRRSDPNLAWWASDKSSIEDQKEEQEESQQLDQFDISEASKELAEDVSDGSLMRSYGWGDSPDERLIQWAREERRKHGLDCWSLFDKQFSRACDSVKIKGASDLSYTVRNPNQPQIGPVLMGLLDYSPNTYLVQDVSGSMAAFMENSLDLFKDVMGAIATKYGAELRWFTVDTKIVDTGVLTTFNPGVSQRFRRGYGGTVLDEILGDMSKGRLRWKGKKFRKPDIILISTDCLFSWPWLDLRKPPAGVEIIVLSVTKWDDLAARIDMPEWLVPGKNFIYVDD